MASLENFRTVVFRAVAEHLSFRKAAEDLYLTQPAVSLQIKALEEELGVQLFDRTGGHIALTSAGKLLLSYSKQAKALLSHAEQEIAALCGEHSGELALGASTTIAQYVLPHLLGTFCKQRPRIHPTLVSGNTEHIVEAIEKQKIEIGFIEGPARSRDVKTEPFLEDEIVLIASNEHVWGEHDSCSVTELATVPLLMRERGSGTRQVIEMAMLRRGVKRSSLNIVMELDSTEAIKSAVDAGFGVGFVSRCAIEKDMRLGSSFRIIRIEGLRIKRDFLIAYPTGTMPQGLAGEFRRYLLSITGVQKRLNAVTTQSSSTTHNKNK